MDIERITPYEWAFAAGLWVHDVFGEAEKRRMTADDAIEALQLQPEAVQTDYLRRATERDRTLSLQE